MSAKWTFWAWEQPIKQAPKKLALLQLANNANDDGKSWYSIVKMAKSCGVSERTFQRSIQELEKANILHVERRSNRPSIYTLAEAIEVVLHGGDNVTGCQPVTVGCQSDGAGCQSVTSGGVTVSPVLNSNPNNDLNNTLNSDNKKKSNNKFCASEYVKQLERVDINIRAWNEWVEFRRTEKKAISKTAVTKQLNILSGHTFDQQQQIVDKSIAGDYTGLFAINNKTQAKFAKPVIDNTDLSWMENKTFEEKYCDKN